MRVARCLASPPMRPLQERHGEQSDDERPNKNRGPRWLAWLPFLEQREQGAGLRVNMTKVLHLLRMMGVGFLAMAAFLSMRTAMLSQQRNAPKEVRAKRAWAA